MKVREVVASLSDGQGGLNHTNLVLPRYGWIGHIHYIRLHLPLWRLHTVNTAQAECTAGSFRTPSEGANVAVNLWLTSHT